MRKYRNHLPVIDRVAKIPWEAHIEHHMVKACKAIQPDGNINTEERQSCGSKVLINNEICWRRAGFVRRGLSTTVVLTDKYTDITQ